MSLVSVSSLVFLVDFVVAGLFVVFGVVVCSFVVVDVDFDLGVVGDVVDISLSYFIVRLIFVVVRC